jgi:hypothetical protein
MPETNRPDGRLTGYGFACGYGEEYGDWLHGDGVRLFRLSGGGYEVRGGPTWETFHLLAEARRFARTFGPFTLPR